MSQWLSVDKFYTVSVAFLPWFAGLVLQVIYLGHSLNSSKGAILGDYTGDYYRVS